MKKNIIGAIIGAGLVLATAMPALAADECTNATTGWKSWNFCVKAQVKALKLPVRNTGTIVQDVTTRANTGNNQSNLNTVGSSIDGYADPTGNASSTVYKEAALNLSDLDVSQTGSEACPDCGGLTGKNSVTGPESVNVVGVVDVKLAEVSVDNEGTIRQTVKSTANTGNNEANKNTVSGIIDTGNATARTELWSVMNNTTVKVQQ